MTSFPSLVRDLVFEYLTAEDLIKTLQVSKEWFFASLSAIKELKIPYNFSNRCVIEEDLLTMAVDFYNYHRGKDPPITKAFVLSHMKLETLILPQEIPGNIRLHLEKNGGNTRVLVTNLRMPLTLHSLLKFKRLHKVIVPRFAWSSSTRASLSKYLEGFQLIAYLVSIGKVEGFEIQMNHDDTITITSLAIKCGTIGATKQDTVDILVKVLKQCPNLERLTLIGAQLTKQWRQILPPSLKFVLLEHAGVSADEGVITRFESRKDLGSKLQYFLCLSSKTVLNTWRFSIK